MKAEVIPFGKYKGQPVEILQQDKEYVEWLLNQDWFKSRYQNINNLIINNFQEPSETPEHNSIQAMFIEENFCKKFVERSFKETQFPCIEIGSGDYNFFSLEIIPINYDWTKIEISKLEFEEKGIDVKFSFRIDFRYDPSLNKIYKEKYPDNKKIDFSFHSINEDFTIEIKPSLSDDYPAVLRQMKSNNSKYLFAKEYIGKGATLEQVKKIFKSSCKYIILLSDLL